MAVFKSLRKKPKEYVFKFGGNEKLKTPAKAVFARFPLPDETFLKSGADTRYGDVDWGRIGKKDQKEVEKLFSAFITNFMSESAGMPVSFSRVDYGAFLTECVDRFENLFVEEPDGETSEVKLPGDFLRLLPEAAAYEIARGLYAYAREKEDFSMGESKA
jgi:hypothetical protein